MVNGGNSMRTDGKRLRNVWGQYQKQLVKNLSEKKGKLNMNENSIILEMGKWSN